MAPVQKGACSKPDRLRNEGSPALNAAQKNLRRNNKEKPKVSSPQALQFLWMVQFVELRAQEMEKGWMERPEPLRQIKLILLDVFDRLEELTQ